MLWQHCVQTKQLHWCLRSFTRPLNTSESVSHVNPSWRSASELDETFIWQGPKCKRWKSTCKVIECKFQIPLQNSAHESQLEAMSFWQGNGAEIKCGHRTCSCPFRRETCLKNVSLRKFHSKRHLLAQMFSRREQLNVAIEKSKKMFSFSFWHGQNAKDYSLDGLHYKCNVIRTLFDTSQRTQSTDVTIQPADYIRDSQTRY